MYPYGVSYACPACRLHMLYHFTLGDLPKCLRENETKVVAFNQKRVHKGGVICISEVIAISPGNLDSSLCFFQPSISHDAQSCLTL